MEGERAFVQNAAKLGQADLLKDNPGIAFKYNLGGGYRKSDGWEPLGQAGYYDTFGPELSFAGVLQAKRLGNVAIAKFTHSGSQIIDWTPEGSMARSRHIYPEFVKFIQQSIRELEAKGHKVRLAGIVYHLGENDMSFLSLPKRGRRAIADDHRAEPKGPWSAGAEMVCQPAAADG